MEIQKDFNTLTMTIYIKGHENIMLTFGSIYGNEITRVLFEREYSLSDLLILRYDDIWLGQLTAISERSFLLKYQENYTLIIKSLLKKDYKARKLNEILKQKWVKESSDQIPELAEEFQISENFMRKRLKFKQE
ncbi:MAG: hypothetical protein QXO75_00085 [Nitrososphaerota archaeon]